MSTHAEKRRQIIDLAVEQSPDSTWDHCCCCGTSDVAYLGIYLSEDCGLWRTAWCAEHSCREDRDRTHYMPVAVAEVLAS